MNTEDTEKVALALITRYFDDPGPIERFLDNASSFGHSIDRIIVAYSHGVEEQVVRKLLSRVQVDLVRAHNDLLLKKRLQRLGLTHEQAEGLLLVPSWPCHQEVPYGAYRNAVLIHALLENLDYLLFFDDDIYPKGLKTSENDRFSWRELDFVGSHIEYLSRPGVTATTSDYSGYYIIPPMGFDGMDHLLMGLGKSKSIEYMKCSQEHDCLVFAPASPQTPFITRKLLGGNLGLSLRSPWRLAPFFSTTYSFEGTCILGRGEDTLLGVAISEAGGTALDIDLMVFHDTFGDFPAKPIIQKRSVRDRFYRACLGWIGRNPFLVWSRAQQGFQEEEYEKTLARQRAALEYAGPKAGHHLEDVRFAMLSDALDTSISVLPDMIHRFTRLKESWTDLIAALMSSPQTSELGEGDQLPLAS
jgi:hypothetical protein